MILFSSITNFTYIYIFHVTSQLNLLHQFSNEKINYCENFWSIIPKFVPTDKHYNIPPNGYDLHIKYSH